MTLSFSVLFLFFCFVFGFFFLLILSLSPPTYACVCVSVSDVGSLRCCCCYFSLLHAAHRRDFHHCVYRATTIGAAIRFCATGSTKKLVNRCRVNAIQCNQIRLVKYSNMAIIADTLSKGEGVSITHNRYDSREIDESFR